MAMEQVRLRELHPAVARRVLRAAARRLGARLSFEHTEQLLALAGPKASGGGKFDLPGGITVERSLREIRLTRSSNPPRNRPGARVCHPGRNSRARVRPEPARRVGGNHTGNLKALESRGSGNAAAQPGSQKSCRGSGPAPRGGRGAEKLAGGRVGGKDCLDARGRGRCPWISVYDFALPNFHPDRRAGVIGWSVPCAYNFGHTFPRFRSRFRLLRSRINETTGRCGTHTVIGRIQHQESLSESSADYCRLIVVTAARTFPVKCLASPRWSILFIEAQWKEGFS